MSYWEAGTLSPLGIHKDGVSDWLTSKASMIRQSLQAHQCPQNGPQSFFLVNPYQCTLAHEKRL